MKPRLIIIAGTVLVCAALVGTWLMTQGIEKNGAEEHALVAHSNEVVDTLLTIDADLFEMSSQSGLMQDAPSLNARSAFESDAAKTLADIARVTALTADNPRQTELAGNLLHGAEGLVATLRLRPGAPHRTIAEQRIQALTVDRVLPDVRGRAGRMIALERELLTARSTADDLATTRLNETLKAVLGLAGLAAILALWAVYYAGHSRLEAAQSRLRSVLDRATDAIFLVSRNGVIRLANAAAANLFGIPIDDFPGRPIADRLIGRTEDGGEAEGVRADGTRFPSDVSVGRADARQPDETVYIVRDLSERRAVEANLRHSQEQFQILVQGVKDYAIYMLDPDGRVASWNAGAQKIKGYLPSEILGEHFSRFYTEDDRESGKPAAALDTAKREGRFENDGWRVRKDGSRFWANVVIEPILAVNGALLGYAKITRDNTERHHLAQLKREFVSTVSHELRTPLTSIRGSLGLVVAGAAGELPPKAQRFLEIAYNNSGRLIHLVNDILDVEKIESGRMAFQRERVAAQEIIEQAMEANQAYADELGVAIRVVATLNEGIDVFGDMLRIQQVMANLLSNAAKFSPRGSSVEVAARADRESIRISVRDRGEGIPIAFRHRIFQRFAQADSSDQRKIGGTGLGLSISKAIVEQHGGSIGFDCPGDGGTEFWFTLPRMPVAPAAPAEAKPEPAARHVDRPRILVVEDDPDVARVLCLMLEHNGWATAVAHSAADAEALLHQARYDAMTLDVRLPDDNGLNLLRTLRSRAETRDMPVVVVSAQLDDTGERINGAAIDVIDWLDKPIDEGRLRRAILRALAQRNHTAAALPCILHIEDDPDIVQIVRGVMAGEADTVAAPTFTEALRLFAARHYALVIIDIDLPDGSGLEIIEPIRRLREPPPMLIFSARDYDAADGTRVAATLVKSRTDNRLLHDAIHALISGETAIDDRLQAEAG